VAYLDIEFDNYLERLLVSFSFFKCVYFTDSLKSENLEFILASLLEML
jgi:hypothetical protein